MQERATCQAAGELEVGTQLFDSLHQTDISGQEVHSYREPPVARQRGSSPLVGLVPVDFKRQGLAEVLQNEQGRGVVFRIVGGPRKVVNVSLRGDHPLEQSDEKPADGNHAQHGCGVPFGSSCARRQLRAETAMDLERPGNPSQGEAPPRGNVTRQAESLEKILKGGPRQKIEGLAQVQAKAGQISLLTEAVLHQGLYLVRKVEGRATFDATGDRPRELQTPRLKDLRAEDTCPQTEEAAEYGDGPGLCSTVWRCDLAKDCNPSLHQEIRETSREELVQKRSQIGQGVTRQQSEVLVVPATNTGCFARREAASDVVPGGLV